MWSQCWVHSKCDQPVIGSHIVVTLGQSFKMGVICNQRAHFGYSGSKNSECAQFLTIAHIVDPLQRTFKMYPIFNHWVHCGQVLSVPTMYSPCAHWLYGSLSPVSTHQPAPSIPALPSPPVQPSNPSLKWHTCGPTKVYEKSRSSQCLEAHNNPLADKATSDSNEPE